MFNDLYFAIQTTLPIFTIIVLGLVFKKIGWMTDDFARMGSALVFKVSLPCLLFVKIVQTNFRDAIPVGLVLYAIVATTLVFVVLDRLLAPRLNEAHDRGAFVQGSFRSNMGIIGLAYCISAFGEGVVAKVSIYLALMTMLYNVLSVITLTRHKGDTDSDLLKVFAGIAKNPLILSISAAIIISLSGLQVSSVLLDTGSYFARLSLPLALLCAGATIRLQEFQTSRPLYWACSAKLFVIPLLITVGGFIVGLGGEDLGILFLMCASPTAAASYPMTRSMGGNHHLAAAIIAATSLGALVSITLGVFLLRTSGLI